MLDVNSLCSGFCDLAGTENNSRKITDDMRKECGSYECVMGVLKPGIVISFALRKGRMISSVAERFHG
jgi:hypothetical protein